MSEPSALRGVEPARLLVCFSHLRWDFVFQRPQHLLVRAARTARVIYFEEPMLEAGATPRLALRTDPSGVRIAVPVLPPEAGTEDLRRLLDGLLAQEPGGERIGWYYTPMALEFSGHVGWDVCVYDCMDELSAFRNPPPGLAQNEERLFAQADLVFCGGYSLYEAKRRRHGSVHAFPSSVDAAHFAAARGARPDPEDQRDIPLPRVGFFGVIDERMDLDLVARAAAQAPEIQFVMLGPVVKIDPASLPRAQNLHWLGAKRYEALPDYLANWTAGWMPFALNASTRFISPTKTPEFLAAGLPVVSTAVPDVVRGYGKNGLVAIADHASIAAALRAAIEPRDPAWLKRVDAALAAQSWDWTWAGMSHHVDRIGIPPAAALLRKEA